MNSMDSPYARSAHAGRVMAAVELAREGLIVVEGDSTDGPLPCLETALEVLGIRPPEAYVEQLRHRYPRLYAEAETTRDTGDERDLVRRLNTHALKPYAEDLLDLVNRVEDLEEDPVGTYTAVYETEGLAIPVAEAAYDQLEQHRDDLDQLVGASYAPTHTPA